MTLSGLLMFLSGLWITSSSFTHDGHQSRPRIRITHEDMSFLSQKLPSTQNHSVLRLVKDPNGHDIYAGSPNGLYVFREDSKQLTSIHVPLFKTNCQDSTPCGYKISLLKEGTNGNPLFVCGEQQKDRVCCQVSSNGDPVDCFNMEHRPNINEPSLHIGDALFFTLSGDSNTDATIGLYKKSNHSYTRPLSSKREQRYVKIIADKATNSLEGKLYSFYIEMNTNKDPEMPLWIPKVSQFCMADEGGVKNQLQSRWTSMLTARLFCGDEGKRISFTQLLDVAVLEAEDWDRSLIYALFRNDYNLSAICVYEMANISHTFRSSTFTVNEDLDMSASPRPGECVPNKNFPSNFLRFMQKCPEMNDWVKPARGPMMLSRHHHYTHLQVDRLDGGSILLLALENGRVHKVLDQDGEAFIIAEYEPFTSKTRVQSFLLDRSTKRLFLSSSSEVVRMDLQDCSVYGTHCCFCMQARDPYCGWSQDISRCSPANKVLRLWKNIAVAGHTQTFAKRHHHAKGFSILHELPSDLPACFMRLVPGGEQEGLCLH
ncbi:semaphorin-7A isoform X2 [Brachyhypopomus gauderio]|uniref:semaphorin-7A isoform X2 n=1 Tax=Brachyhypopomus gauderio TaxID=698409 RepID=UPI00404352FE